MSKRHIAVGLALFYHLAAVVYIYAVGFAALICLIDCIEYRKAVVRYLYKAYHIYAVL